MSAIQSPSVLGSSITSTKIAFNTVFSWTRYPVLTHPLCHPHDLSTPVCLLPTRHLTLTNFQKLFHPTSPMTRAAVGTSPSNSIATMTRSNFCCLWWTLAWILQGSWRWSCCCYRPHLHCCLCRWFGLCGIFVPALEPHPQNLKQKGHFFYYKELKTY